MRTAYNEAWLKNLLLVKEAKQWLVSGLISKEQFDRIKEHHPSQFYHPNLIIRILLFLATLVVLSAVTGLLTLAVMDGNEDTIGIMSIFYGLVSLLVLDKVFIGGNHYKSGLSEALLYHSICFIVFGFIPFFEDEMWAYAILFFIVGTFASYRYLDLISATLALGSLAYLIFYFLYQAGGVIQQIIPLVFIAIFTPLYFLFNRLKKRSNAELWENCLIVCESICLLLVYAAGNYLVVRELSIAMMSMELADGEDIPLAMIFYGLTILIPLLYLFFGIRNKDLVLIRVSLGVLAFSAFTFKFYYSTGHHEITFTLSGSFLLITSVSLLRWLKTPRDGYTRENILNEKWANSNLQAFIVSQTLGSVKPTEQQTQFGGGESGGGGSNTSF